jgi:hypothetical protein
MNLKAEIRRYLLDHEAAAETSEGVMRVWLKLPRSAAQLREVEEALDALIDEGFVERHEIFGGGAIYRRRREGQET